MYCSQQENVMSGSEGLGEGAVKGEMYHWERKSYG